MIERYDKLLLEFSEDEMFYRVVKCDKDAVTVEIPKVYQGMSLIEIAEFAFEDCVDLKSIKFPEYSLNDYLNDTCLETIGQYAFSGCVSLEEVNLPFTVNMVERGAFYRCAKLKKVTFDEGVYIGDYCFAHCVSLEEVSNIFDIGEGVFSHCKSLKYLPLDELSEEIGEDAFEHCYSLEEITIPESMKFIGSLAFRSCYNLKKVYFKKLNGWYTKISYTDEVIDLDLGDPVQCAKDLSRMDFDDGILGWFCE